MAKKQTAPAAAASAIASPAVATGGPGKGAAYVVVASKIPQSLELQLCKPTTARVTGQWGSTTEDAFMKVGPVYVIRGTAYPCGQGPKGFPKIDLLDDSGYAMTKGIPQSFWDAWYDQNKETEMVRNGLIKAHPDYDYLVDHLAAECKDVDSGLGPMNPDGDPRAPKPYNSLISEIKTEPRNTTA